MKRIICFCLILCSILEVYAHRVWIVSNTNAVTSAVGIGRANKGDLKYCIDKYTSGDVITFAPELAGKIIYFETGLTLKTNASLTIDASNLSSNVIFDGSFKTLSPKRINILINGSQGYGTNYFTIRAVTFQNICVADYISSNMGALYLNHGTVIVENCEFRDNIFYAHNIVSGSSVQGAIICASAGRTSLTVRSSKFINNFGRRGSAISIWPFKQALVDACYFEANNTLAGGACVYINSSGTDTGGGSLTEIRNCTMTKNKGNAHGTLVSNQSMSNNAYLRILGCTMVDNTSTTTTSTGMAMINTVGRRLEIGGTIFGQNLNQNSLKVSDLSLGNSSSEVLPEDSLTLLGYNIFSEFNNFGAQFTEIKLQSSPGNLIYNDWTINPLTSVIPSATGLLKPSDDLRIQNKYLCIIPREIYENWMFAPAYDQLLKRRTADLCTLGAHEINSSNDTINDITSLQTLQKGIILLDKGAYMQLVGFENDFGEITLHNLKGIRVKSLIQPLLAPIRIEELPSGIYIVKASNSSFKFVK